MRVWGFSVKEQGKAPFKASESGIFGVGSFVGLSNPFEKYYYLGHREKSKHAKRQLRVFLNDLHSAGGFCICLA